MPDDARSVVPDARPPFEPAVVAIDLGVGDAAIGRFEKAARRSTDCWFATHAAARSGHSRNARLSAVRTAWLPSLGSTKCMSNYARVMHPNAWPVSEA